MKNALVTGSTKGIGLQIGLDLLKANYNVYFNARTEPTAEFIDSVVGSFLPQFRFIKADLSYQGSVADIIQQMPDEGLDVIVLNVGITDRTTEQYNFEQVVTTNAIIPYWLIKELKPFLHHGGSIILITSISGIVPDSVSTAYGISKAAENMMVAYLAKEFAPKRITVNAVAPGYIDTTWHDTKDEDQKQRIANKILLKRFGTTKEVSQVVQMLINNDYITGQVIRVDGGFGLA
jgi:3-oxoacyl-[acyl-carrier protein] reductase